ncbi:MAG: T9SS type A sorting domain-containing protein [Flavobacteriaceae bacterium]|nr:T9SS type A sorting domain-containing protein [Flavobacteriaceae bacterium]
MKIQFYFFLFLFSGISFSQISRFEKEWGTYLGSAHALNKISSIEKDADENIFVVISISHLTSDILKFSPSGDLLWVETFGNEFEIGSLDRFGIDDIKIDANNDLLICGWTNLTGLGTPGVFQEQIGGQMDRFLAKMNSETGDIIWFTYFGGAAHDDDSEGDSFFDYNSMIAFTPDNNIIWTTNIRSENMATPGVFQENMDDATYVISNFTSSGQRNWTTYYGYDYSTISGLAVDETGIYVAGRTGYNFSGVHNDTYFDPSGNWQLMPGKSDMYLSKFDHTANRVWSRYYGGPDLDLVLMNSLSLKGNQLFLCGNTFSNTGIATPNGHIIEKPEFARSGFLASFDLAGNTLWGTYLGDFSPSNTFNSSFSHADSPYIFVIGSTAQPGLATSNAFQENILGGNDMFVMLFEISGELIYSTYFGGEGEEVGFFHLVILENGFCLAGHTQSASHISTPDAYIEDYSGHLHGDLFIAKFVQTSLSVTDASISQNSFVIYPNPATDVIHIQLNHANSTAKIKGRIFNAAGQWIQNFSFTGTEHQIPTSSLPTGQYFVTLEIDGKIFSKTFLVK